MNVKGIFIVLLTCCSLFFTTVAAQSNRIWATYYGGADTEFNQVGLVVDPFSNVYMSATTNSASGIAFNGFQNTKGAYEDAFLVKFDAAGNRLWATYYGGASTDWGMEVATDASGNVYLGGQTGSTSGIASGGFQNTIGGGRDAFLVKFDANGNRLWATYYGGPGTEYLEDVHVDVSGNVYISGNTTSTSGIASGGFQNTFGGGYDSFVVKFDAAGNRLWATYYGATGAEERGFLSSDQSGNIFLVGRTSSTAASMTTPGCYQSFNGGGIQDGFIVKFDTNGNRLWGTYFGGNSMDGFFGVGCDGAGNVYVSGATTSTANVAFNGFQNTYAGSQDGLVAKFSPQGTLLWATYYGGPGHDTFWGLAVDNAGYSYVPGYTASSTAIASGGFQNTFAGQPLDACIVSFDPSGNRLCASYYGDTDYDRLLNAATDGGNVVYAAGWTLNTTNIASGGFQNTFAGGDGDMFLVKFTTCNAMNVAAAATDVNCFGDCTGTATATVTGGVPPFSYTWNTSPPQITQNATGLCAGTYSVLITDATSNFVSATVQVTQPMSLQLTTTSTPEFCNALDGTASVSASGGVPGYAYLWSNGAVTDSISNLPPGVYTATVTDANGCSAQQSTTVAITGAGPANAGPDVVINIGASTVLNGSGGGNYNWTPAQDLSCATCPNPIASPTVTTTYTLTVTDSLGCTDTAAVTVFVETPCDLPFVPNAFTPNDDGQNDVLFVRGECIAEFNFQVYNRWGEKVFETSDLGSGWNGTWQGQKCEPAVFTYVLKGTLQTGELFQMGGNVSLVR